MKLIIPLIILFTITCFGQSDTPAGHISLTFDSGLLTEMQTTMTWETLIENWQEYQSECGESERCYEVYVRYTRTPHVIYPDTSYVPCGNIEPRFTEGYKGRIAKKVKNKPTFEGFMQFLVKKYGGNKIK